MTISQTVEVEQADRDMAAEMMTRRKSAATIAAIRAGEMDDYYPVQSFARHRLQSLSLLQEENEALRAECQAQLETIQRMTSLLEKAQRHLTEEGRTALRENGK